MLPNLSLGHSSSVLNQSVPGLSKYAGLTTGTGYGNSLTKKKSSFGWTPSGNNAVKEAKKFQSI